MKNYHILPGLPAEGPYPEQFTCIQGNKNYSEGLVVEFYPSSKSSWIGNFQLGLTQYSEVLNHLNNKFIVVVAGGQAYIIDINTRNLIDCFGGCILSTFSIDEKRFLILVENNNLICFGVAGVLWEHKVENCDGIRSLKYFNNVLIGEGLQIPEDIWKVFQLDINSGTINRTVFSRITEIRDV